MMQTRLATPSEAEKLWNIRNQAIRIGCKDSYADDIRTAWTPDIMPESYRDTVANNPFFVVDNHHGEPVSTGYLNLAENCIDSIFTLPEYIGRGAASLIIDAIKNEAKERGITQLILDATPNAETFYHKLGFTSLQKGYYYSPLLNAELPCINMIIHL